MNLLTDDTTTGLDIEATAETQRAAAFRAGHHWHGMPLLWTISRESLYFWLRTPAPALPPHVREALAAARDAAGTADHASLLHIANTALTAHAAHVGPDNSYYRNALIILYLAAHSCDDWQSFTHDRQRFLNEIEAWADASIHPGEMVEVATITNAVIADADATRAIPRPRSAESTEAGN